MTVSGQWEKSKHNTAKVRIWLAPTWMWGVAYTLAMLFFNATEYCKHADAPHMIKLKLDQGD